MIAELHGKISSTGSNLTDKMEDKLTGDIFGTLRYAPFGLGIAPILSGARIPELTELIEQQTLVAWADRAIFWPYHPLGELDFRIDLENAVIGIEVKYQSPLSSDDDVDRSITTAEGPGEESQNQLSRESRIVRELAKPGRRSFLILVADDGDCATIIGDVQRRNLIDDGVSLGYISWQEILLLLKKAPHDNPFYACMFDDMISLLKRKGFERFTHFERGLPTICRDEFFAYQDSCDSEINLPKGPTIEEGCYYEFR